MEQKNYEKNAENVLAEVNKLIFDLQRERKCGYIPKYRTLDVCDRLSIFDWWTETLSLSRLKDMRKFLNEAIKLGFTGYVCFKVGVTGCANGMWAHKKLSITGYSPDGACLYKSFTPQYEYWQINPKGEEYLPKEKEFDSLKNIKQLENYIKENNLL